MTKFSPLVLASFLLVSACGQRSLNSPDSAVVLDAAETAIEDAANEVIADLGTEETATPDAGVDACAPACEAFNCGPDGCGGNCGKCGELQVCLDGVCCSAQCEV